VGKKRLTIGTGGLALALIAALWGSTAHAAGPCSPSTPQYCPPPVVVTGPAKNIKTKSATLTGTVNPSGSATSCAFAYGKTTSYGKSTPVQSVGSGTSFVSVEATIHGLTPNTGYHYQLVCQNLGGFGFGGDRTFTTGSKIKIKTTIAFVAPNGKVGFKLGCVGKFACKGTLSLKGLGGKALANSKKFTIKANRTKTVFLKLKLKPLNDLKSSKSHKRKARVTAKTKAGAKATKVITLKLKP
jgi:hypothetical protein